MPDLPLRRFILLHQCKCRAGNFHLGILRKMPQKNTGKRRFPRAQIALEQDNVTFLHDTCQIFSNILQIRKRLVFVNISIFHIDFTRSVCYTGRATGTIAQRCENENMNWLKDIFNCNSFPRTISALPSEGPGYEVRNLCGRDVTDYNYDDYRYQLYARRSKGREYDIFVKFNNGSFDSGRAMLRCGVALNDAIGIIRGYDDKVTAKRLGNLPKQDHAAYAKRFIDPKRGRNNVRRVQNRLTIANPYGH